MGVDVTNRTTRGGHGCHGAQQEKGYELKKLSRWDSNMAPGSLEEEAGHGGGRWGLEVYLYIWFSMAIFISLVPYLRLAPEVSARSL